MIRRWRHAYQWMMANHPHQHFGIFFVARAPRIDKIDKEYREWLFRLKTRS